MIAPVKPHLEPASHAKCQETFLKLIPHIRCQATIAFRMQNLEARDELVAQVIANAYCALVELFKRGKQDLAHPSTLAGYAIRHVRSGRQAGTKLNATDITSHYAQRRNGICVERLDRFDPVEKTWQEALVEDRQAGPAETAAARLDVAQWLRSFGPKKRRIAEAMAVGERTAEVARLFGLSPGRISQLRLEFKRSWESFQGQMS